MPPGPAPDASAEAITQIPTQTRTRPESGRRFEGVNGGSASCEPRDRRRGRADSAGPTLGAPQSSARHHIARSRVPLPAARPPSRAPHLLPCHDAQSCRPAGGSVVAMPLRLAGCRTGKQQHQRRRDCAQPHALSRSKRPLYRGDLAFRWFAGCRSRTRCQAARRFRRPCNERSTVRRAASYHQRCCIS
jgi:hypothetical protein